MLQMFPGTLRTIPWPILEGAVQTSKAMEPLPRGGYCNYSVMQVLGVTNKCRVGHSNDRKVWVDELGGCYTTSMNKHKVKEWEQEEEHSMLVKWNNWLTNTKQQLVTPGHCCISFLWCYIVTCNKQSSLAHLCVWAQLLPSSFRYASKRSFPVIEDTSCTSLLTKLQSLFLTLSTVLKTPVFMAIPGCTGGCSKGWMFAWSPSQIPICCFFL